MQSLQHEHKSKPNKKGMPTLIAPNLSIVYKLNTWALHLHGVAALRIPDEPSRVEFLDEGHQLGQGRKPKAMVNKWSNKKH